MRNNVVHELGHLFSITMGNTPSSKLDVDRAKNKNLQRDTDPNSFNGFADQGIYTNWQQHACNLDDHTEPHPWPCEAGSELFANQFLGWTFNTWETDTHGNLTDAGMARSNWMNRNMYVWLMRALHPERKPLEAR